MKTNHSVLLFVIFLLAIQPCRAASVPFLWAKSAGGSGIDSAGGVAVDSAGNCYATGTFTGTATFGALSLTSSGDGDVFVAKYNGDGVLQWVRKAGGTRNDEGHAIALDTAGDIYVTGTFFDTALFGPISVSSSGSADAFVAKLNRMGDVVWVARFGGSGTDSPEALALDQLGNSYVTGYFQGRAQIGAFSVTGGGGPTDMFIAKLDPRGRVEWARGAGGSDLDQGKGVAVDSGGNCYVTGFFIDAPANFSGVILTNAGYFDGFLAKYDSAGRVLWARRMGAKGADQVWGIAVSSTGNSYVTGRFQGTVDFGGIVMTSSSGIDAFTAKYDSSGQVKWVRQIGPGQDAGTGIALDKDEACYVVGRVGGETFLAKYDSAGNPKWAQAFGGNYGASKVAVDNSGASYVTGGFHSTATFGNIVLKGGEHDIFVAKRASKVPPVITKEPEGRTVISGSDITLTVDASGPLPLSFQWTKDGGAVSGQTNNTLMLKQAQAQNTGNYVVTVSNAAGIVTSLRASLNVLDIAVLINGRIFTDSHYLAEGPVLVSIQTGFKNGSIFYSLDGTPASFRSSEYAGPFNLQRTTDFNAIVYSQDFLQTRRVGALRMVIPPFSTLVSRTAGGGQITVNPLKPNYSLSDVVTLTGVPQEGWVFLGWRGDTFDTNQTTTVLMDRDKSIEGVFGTRLTTTTVGLGSIAVNPAAEVYPYGSTVQLSAVPALDSQFALWGGSAQGFANPLVFKITDAAPTISSLFVPMPSGQISLTVIPVGLGTVSINPQARTFGIGEKVTLEASPDRGQEFIGWTGSMNTDQNPLTITMTSHVKVFARFTQRGRLSITGDKSVRQIVLSGAIGGRYRIEGSSKLVDWIPLATIQTKSGVANFIDDSSFNVTARYYRAVSVEP